MGEIFFLDILLYRETSGHCAQNASVSAITTTNDGLRKNRYSRNASSIVTVSGLLPLILMTGLAKGPYVRNFFSGPRPILNYAQSPVVSVLRLLLLTASGQPT